MTKPQAMYSSTRRQGKLNDWQIYRRLLGYVSALLVSFPISVFGFLLYSLGNVLLADMMQFLLDSLNESASVASGIVSGWLTACWMPRIWGVWNSRAWRCPWPLSCLPQSVAGFFHRHVFHESRRAATGA